MFTLSDICDIAIQIERNGENAYREAAKQARTPEVVRLFEMLAEDETKHMHWFEQMDVNQSFTAKDQQIARMGRELLQEMMAPQTFSLDREALAAADSSQKVLHQSIEFEKDTILFYEMLASFLDDEKTKQQLDLIIEEEHSHIDKLQEILALQDELGMRVV